MEFPSKMGQMHELAKDLRHDPWPVDAIIYMPYEKNQILLAEQASCLSVITYLKFCNLPFKCINCEQAEKLTPGGRLTKLPFLRAGPHLFSEFEPIVNYVEQKNFGLDHWLTEDKQEDAIMVVNYVENTFTLAQIYLSFLDKKNYSKFTAPRYSCIYNWPYNIIQNIKKRNQAIDILKIYQWKDLSIKDVQLLVKQCCEILTVKLEDHNMSFFYGEQLSTLDAIVFGHVFVMLSTKLPNPILTHTIAKHKRLLDYIWYINDQYMHLPKPELD